MEYILKFDWGDAGKIDSHWLIHVVSVGWLGQSDSTDALLELKSLKKLMLDLIF